MLDEINAGYAALSLGDYPFISKNSITILHKGFYTKKNAKYRGVACRFHKKSESYITTLSGYYHVPENCIVVPIGLEITPKKQELINTYTQRGYEVINGFPSLYPYTFDPDSYEARMAREARDIYKMTTV